MSTFAAHAGVETAALSQITDLVVPLDITTIPAWTDLKLVDPSVVARRQKLRTIAEDAIDEEWKNLTPLLAPNGAYAGGAAFAHAVVSDRVYQSRQEAFEQLDNVTLKELWPICHELLKKRGLVFERGFVTGIRR